MKAIVITRKNGTKRFLVEIQTDVLVQEIAALIGRKRYFEAATVTLAKGLIEREIVEDDIKNIKADLVIDEDGVL